MRCRKCHHRERKGQVMPCLIMSNLVRSEITTLYIITHIHTLSFILNAVTLGFSMKLLRPLENRITQNECHQNKRQSVDLRNEIKRHHF